MEHQKQCPQRGIPETMVEEACLCEADHKAGKPEDCPADECFACAFEQCPFQCVLHYHHDGCPACATAEEFDKIPDKKDFGNSAIPWSERS